MSFAKAIELDLIGQSLDFRSFIIDGYILSSVAEIAFEPIKSYSSDAVMV